jgi:hypothetical protein
LVNRFCRVCFGSTAILALSFRIDSDNNSNCIRKEKNLTSESRLKLKIHCNALIFCPKGGEPYLPPRGVKSPKRKRQYEHIKESELERGRSESTAERIAAATTNKTRKKEGETKS